MFFHCNCGKLHLTGMIGVNTQCTCGANLYRMAAGTINPDYPLPK